MSDITLKRKGSRVPTIGLSRPRQAHRFAWAARFAHLVGLDRRKAQTPRERTEERTRPAPRVKASSARRDPVEVTRTSDARAEMEGDGPIADARRRERARCAAIIGAGLECGQLDLAKSLAFHTTETRDEAITFLSSRARSPKEQRSRSWSTALRVAASGRSAPRPPDQSGWDRAFNRVGKTGG